MLFEGTHKDLGLYLLFVFMILSLKAKACVWLKLQDILFCYTILRVGHACFCFVIYWFLLIYLSEIFQYIKHRIDKNGNFSLCDLNVGSMPILITRKIRTSACLLRYV